MELDHLTYEPDGSPANPEAEWPATLDVDALLASGFRPQPFRQFVLKLINRCDLACDYCYMFEKADQSWRAKPARMSSDVVAQVAARIAEHVRAHALNAVTVVLHGGEPLLVGPQALAEIAQALRDAIPAACALDLRVQTNGTRLIDRVIDVLQRYDIRVAVSVDGDRRSHDRHRTRAGGRGSYDLVASGVARLTALAPQLFAGLLCTVDLEADPLDVYHGLLQLRPPVVDLLLPHATWSDPPVRRGTGPDAGSEYGRWLAAVFDRWYDTPRPPTRVRMFEELISLILGGSSRVETIGLSPVAVVVVDTDGALEQVDTLRAAYQGATVTGFDVHNATFDAIARHPGIVARQIGAGALAPTCRTCPVHRVCGGGYYPHRYRPGSGFLNPSVYCRDLEFLIRHVHGRLRADLSARAAAPAC
jgi:uncharacterized protein